MRFLVASIFPIILMSCGSNPDPPSVQARFNTLSGSFTRTHVLAQRAASNQELLRTVLKAGNVRLIRLYSVRLGRTALKLHDAAQRACQTLPRLERSGSGPLTRYFHLVRIATCDLVKESGQLRIEARLLAFDPLVLSTRDEQRLGRSARAASWFARHSVMASRQAGVLRRLHPVAFQYST